MTHSGSGWQKLRKGPWPKSFYLDKKFYPYHKLYCRDIKISELKAVLLGQEVHYYMVYVAYQTKLNLQICNYLHKGRICRKNTKYALDDKFYGHFCSRRKAANFYHPAWLSLWLSLYGSLSQSHSRTFWLTLTPSGSLTQSGHSLSRPEVNVRSLTPLLCQCIALHYVSSENNQEFANLGKVWKSKLVPNPNLPNLISDR